MTSFASQVGIALILNDAITLAGGGFQSCQVKDSDMPSAVVYLSP